MVRTLYIPTGLDDGLATLFSLPPDNLRAFQQVLTDPKNETNFDVHLGLMNRLSLTDEQAEDAFEAYKYVTFVLSQKGVSVENAVAEIAIALEASEHPQAALAAENLRNNVTAFTQLFGADSVERQAAKRQFLTSQLYNSVIDLHSICDLRPVFNTERSTIVDWLVPVYLEFSVTDSAGSPKVVPLNFDERSFGKLKDEIARVERKLAVLEGHRKQGRGAR